MSLNRNSELPLFEKRSHSLYPIISFLDVKYMNMYVDEFYKDKEEQNKWIRTQTFIEADVQVKKNKYYLLKS